MIILYYPAIGVGGAEFLFLRLAKELLQRGASVKVVDYRDGFFSQRLNENTVLICNKNGQIDIRKLGVVTVVAFSTRLDDISKIKADKGSKLVIWEIHKAIWNSIDNSTRPKLWKLLSKKVALNVLNKAADHKALFVLEHDSIKCAKEFGIKNHQQMPIIPIPIEQNGGFLEKGINESQIRLGSVCRAVESKIKPLVWFMNSIKNKFGTCSMLIITDDIDEAKKTWKELNKGMLENVYFSASIEGSALKQALVKSVDIYVGMGTSVLEAASAGIPSLIVDECRDVYPANAKVRYIWENNLRNLGATEPSVSYGPPPTAALDFIRNNYHQAADKSFNYCKENHNILSCVDKFLSACNDSTLLLSESVTLMWSIMIYQRTIRRRLLMLLKA